MKIVLGDFNAKVGKEDIFKPTVGNECLHLYSNDKGVRTVNFATSKNLAVKSTMIPHRNFHKHNSTTPDGKNHNYIEHILIERRWHSSILDVRGFRGAERDSDHYLLVANIRERSAVNNQAVQKFDGNRLISGTYMNWRLRNSIRLRLQTGVQFRRT